MKRKSSKCEDERMREVEDRNLYTRLVIMTLKIVEGGNYRKLQPSGGQEPEILEVVSARSHYETVWPYCGGRSIRNTRKTANRPSVVAC